MTSQLNVTNSVLPEGKVKVPPRPQTDIRAPICVNGVEISADAVQAEAQNHPVETPAKALHEAAQALVVREVLLQKAQGLNISAIPEVLGEGKKETDEDALIRALLDVEISTPKADMEACQRYYDANLDRFRTETIYEARHILFAAAIGDDVARAKAQEEAEAAIAILKKDISQFGTLAMGLSACSSRETGGSLGQLTKGSTVPEFETVLFALQEGQLSPTPVPTPYGYHIISLDRVITGERLPFEMVQQRIAAWLEAASWSRAVSQYIGILTGEAEIHGFDIAGTKTPLVQ